MLIGMGLLGIVLILLGWGIYYKKWHGLISGYNLMSEEEKLQVDIDGLAQALSYMLYVTGALIMLVGVSVELNYFTLLPIITVLIIIIPVVFTFYSKRFYKNGVRLKGNMTSKNKKIAGIITVISLVVVSVILYMSLQPTTFEVGNKDFEISGMYGEAISLKEIKNLQLIEELPPIGARTNGSAIGAKLKGNFKLKDGTVAKLFLDKKIAVFISFETKGTMYIINQPTLAQTKELYAALKNEMK